MINKLKYILIIALALFVVTANAQDDTNGPKIKFENQSHDFNDVTQGEKVSHKFTFKNTGNQPLILNNVLTTCGCTVTDWPKDPIPPGKTGEIEVKFNTAGRMGKQNKVITIISNATTPQTRIKITANVVES
jgi:uncharacterized protein (DUF58 family)